jgi:succinate dehydrogenase/fumarate reductase flavoprotein subunit
MQRTGNHGQLDRRTFLKGTAFAGLGAVAAGSFAACNPLQGSGGDTDDSGADSLPAGSGNPENRWQSQAGADWRKQPEPIDESLIQDGGSFDVVIAGGGNAGTWCARAASRDGASVVLLEAQEEATYALNGSEVGTVNSEWAIAHGAQRIDTVEFLNEVYRRNSGRSNQGILRKFAENSGRLFDWAIEDINDPEYLETGVHVYCRDRTEDMVFDPSGYRFYASTVNFRDDKYVEAPALGGDWMPVVMAHHRNRAIADGTDWRWSTEALYAEKDDTGRVVALIGKDLNNETYYRFVAKKGVVLALGDFCLNVDMLRDLNDEYRNLAESYGDIELATPGFAPGLHDGAGIKIGVWAGGHVEVGPHAGMNTGMASLSTPWGPGFLLLNQDGKRFCDEIAGGAEGAGYQAPRQPRGNYVSFADANWFDVTKKIPPCHGAVDFTYGVPYQLTIGAITEFMNALVPSSEPTAYGSSISPQLVYCANTLEELIDSMGIYSNEEKVTALESIKRYNELAAAQRDTDFGADGRIIKPLDTPPFYGAFGQSDAIMAGLVQTTGLDTNDEHEVLGSDLRPIPGLYACGNDSGNRYVVAYSTPIAGMSLGFCLTEGLLLGEKLAG